MTSSQVHQSLLERRVWLAGVPAPSCLSATAPVRALLVARHRRLRSLWLSSRLFVEAYAPQMRRRTRRHRRHNRSFSQHFPHTEQELSGRPHNLVTDAQVVSVFAAYILPQLSHVSRTVFKVPHFRFNLSFQSSGRRSAQRAIQPIEAMNQLLRTLENLRNRGRGGLSHGRQPRQLRFKHPESFEHESSMFNVDVATACQRSRYS